MISRSKLKWNTYPRRKTKLVLKTLKLGNLMRPSNISPVCISSILISIETSKSVTIKSCTLKKESSSRRP